MKARLPLAATVGASVAAVAWVITAIVCSSRGLDTTDESFYLLSYRWWDVNLDNFTGAQYFYGPIFEVLGFDIPKLRVFRVIGMLIAHGLFGWAFMRWLRLHRPAASATRWWEAGGTAAIVACAGIVYSWLPLSPGYNDLSLTGTVLAAAAALRMARDAHTATRSPWWVPSSLGFLAVFMVLAKWSASTLALGCIGLALLVLVWRRGALEVLRLVALVLVGALAGVVFVDVVLVPIRDLLPPMLAVNSLVADSTNSPTLLLEMYLMRTKELLGDIFASHWPLLGVAALLPFLRRVPRIGAAVAGLALVLAGLEVAASEGVRAGSINLPAICVTIFTPLVVVAVAGLSTETARAVRRGRPGRPTLTHSTISRWVVFTLVLVLPAAQAAGTGNPIHYLAMVGLGIWMAAIITVLTRIETSDLPTRTLVGGVASGLVLCTSLVAVDGLWNHPYRTTGYAESTSTAAGVPPLEGLKLSPAVAESYELLRDRLEPWIDEPGRAMMAFDGMAGIVLLLDGRPVGEAWYGGDPRRAIAGIRRACKDRQPWWGAREPLLIYNRPIHRREIQVLRQCGLDFRRDYERLRPRPIPGSAIQVYVPTTAEETQ